MHLNFLRIIKKCNGDWGQLSDIKYKKKDSNYVTVWSGDLIIAIYTYKTLTPIL